MKDEIKQKGSLHYKTGTIEPIDLLEAGHILHDFAIGSIIKYAYRCRFMSNRPGKLVLEDMDKIIHYAEMIKSQWDDDLPTSPPK